MKKYLSIVLSVLVLAIIVVGMTFWIRAFYNSLQDYRSPLHKIDLPAQSTTTAQTTKLVMVIIGGLGYDDSLSLNLPVLGQLRQIGVNAAIETTPPTYSQTAWATLISGVPSDINDAPPFDLPSEKLEWLSIDTIFKRAKEAELQTALFGTIAWRQLIPPDQLDYSFFAEPSNPEADEVILEEALPYLQNDEVELVVIYFSGLDFVAKNQGGSSASIYQERATIIDGYIGQIGLALDLSKTVLILLSDHGYTTSGGYGGAEVAIIWQPLIMIGQGIMPGNYSDIRQTDIAPTITAMLGLPAPTATRGRILFEMLNLSEAEKSTAQLSLARQRVAMAEAYTKEVAGETFISVPLITNLEMAQDTFRNNNLTGAFQLALLTQKEADYQINVTKIRRTRREQLPRLVAITFLIFGWAVIMWRRRSAYTKTVLITALITIVLYHALFQLQGYGYSISSFINLSDLPLVVIGLVAISLFVGGGILLLLLILSNEQEWLVLLGSGYGFSMVVTFIFILPFFWGYWQNGFIAIWRLPDIDPVFWQISGGVGTLAVAFFGLVLPWLVMSLTMFVNLLRGNINEPQPKAEPNSLPGLHL